MNSEPFQEFILKDEQNFHIAAAVSEAWPEARSRITNTFLDKLSARLLEQLHGWETDTWETVFEHAWATFQLHKPGWRFYWVDLQFADCGENMRLGICREYSLIGNRPFIPELLEVVQKTYPSAKSAKWWEALVVMRSPARNWRTPEILWRMHSDSSFLDAVAEQLVAMAKTTEQILDRVNKKKS
jgi:hypothetical protein